MNESTFERLTAPIRRRIKLMVSRAVGRLVDPNTLLQTVQIELLKGEVLDGIEHCEGYGRTAVPPDGWEGISLSQGGDRAHTVLISAFHRQFRLRGLSPGEVALYTDEGDVIHFKRGNHIYIDSAAKITAKAPNVDVIASAQVTITSPATVISGDVTIGGTLDVDGAATLKSTANVTGVATVGSLSTAGAVTAVGGVTSGSIPFATHVHSGVTTGSGNTGGPQ